MKAPVLIAPFLPTVVVVVVAVGFCGQRRKEDHYHHFHRHFDGKCKVMTIISTRTRTKMATMIINIKMIFNM